MMLLIVFLTAMGSVASSQETSQSLTTVKSGACTFDMNAMKQSYENNRRPVAEQEQVLAEKDADYIIDQVKKRLDYQKCENALRESFVKTGEFSDWCSECMTGEIVLPEPEFGKGPYQTVKQLINQRLPHHSFLSGGIYDDGHRLEVQPSMFRFDMTQLQQERERYVVQTETQARAQEQLIVDQLVPQLQRIDDTKCFEAYVLLCAKMFLSNQKPGT